VAEPERAEGQEQRERGLWPVSCRGERVQAEHGHTRKRADLLFPFLVRSQAAAEEHVAEGLLARPR
jgi:hypothetical protein